MEATSNTAAHEDTITHEESAYETSIRHVVATLREEYEALTAQAAYQAERRTSAVRQAASWRAALTETEARRETVHAALAVLLRDEEEEDTL